MDRQGYTPLMLAIEHGETVGHDIVCSLLIHRGANPLLHAPYACGQPPSPVHLAARHRRYSVLESQNGMVDTDESTIDYWLESADAALEMEKTADPHLTAVVRAVNRGDSRALKHLLDPETLLLMAWDRSDVDMLKALLSRFFTPDKLNGDSSRPGTWFHQNLYALWVHQGEFDEYSTERYSKVLAAFFEAGMRCDIEDADGRSLLHFAAQKGILPWVGPLSEQLALHTRDKSGCTALHCAAAAFHIDFVKTLLSRNVDVNEFDNDGLTPLCHAARAFPTSHLDPFSPPDLQPLAIFDVLLGGGAIPDAIENGASRPVEELWQAYLEEGQRPGNSFDRRVELFERCRRAYEVLLRAGASPATTVPEEPQPRESGHNDNPFSELSAEGRALFSASKNVRREAVRQEATVAASM